MDDNNPIEKLNTVTEAFACRLAEAYHLPPQYAEDVRKVCWCCDRDPFADTDYAAVRLQNQTVCAGKLLYPGTSELPAWVVCAVGEMAVGDLAVSVDGQTTYRLDHGINLVTDPAKLPASYVPCPRVSAALRGEKTEQNGDIEILIRQTLLDLDRIIIGGITWHCSDGEIKAVYYGGTDDRKWIVAYRLDGGEWQGLLPNGRTETDTCDLSDEALEALRHPTIGGRDTRQFGTIELLRKRRNAGDCLRSGCADAGSARNLLMLLAAPYLRDHAEECVVLQGPGSIGKSSILNDMRDLGYPTSHFNLPIDSLSHPVALTAENAMYNLASKMLALCDDYDPHGNWPAAIAKLKPILTGTLPSPPRLQGKNAMTEITKAQSFVLITTNSILPLSSDYSQQRRFAFATISTPGWAKSYRMQKSVLTFDAFMLASAFEWAAAQGRFVHGVPQYASDAEISATIASIIMTIVTDGCVLGDELRRAGITAKSLGLERRHPTAAYCKLHNLHRDTTFAYFAPRPGSAGYAIWAPQLDAVKAANAREEAERIKPVPDGGNMPAGLESVASWSDVLAAAGARTALFPCIAHAARHGDKDRVKAPDTPLLAQITDGVTSWKQLAEQMPDACRDHLDASDAWGMTLLDDRYVWIDCDCHAAGKDSGWHTMQDAVGPYGSDTLPRTFLVRTPSGGVHCLYRLPDGKTLPTHANGDSQVDLRAAMTGYVLAGGSRIDAGDYKPVDVPADMREVPVMSDMLYEWLLDTTQPDKTKRPLYRLTPVVSDSPDPRSWRGRSPFAGMDAASADTAPGIKVDGIPFRLHPPRMGRHAVHDVMCKWFFGLAQKSG